MKLLMDDYMERGHDGEWALQKATARVDGMRPIARSPDCGSLFVVSLTPPRMNLPIVVSTPPQDRFVRCSSFWSPHV